MITAKTIEKTIETDIVDTFGDHNVQIINYGTLDSPKENHIFFIKDCTSVDPSKIPAKSIIILPKEVPEDFKRAIETFNSFGIVTLDPRLSFIRILSEHFAPSKPVGIHPTAIIDESSSVANNCFVGPYSVIEKNCKIGSGTVIHSYVHLYPGTEIGNDCIIHSHTVIGTDGFGYQRNSRNVYEKFIHLGKVIIGNDVEIGGQCCIDRGTLGNTLISNGCKLDNHVHIAHNVQIEENCAITAHVMIAGSAKIGAGTWIGPSSSIINQAIIGKNVFIGIGANVIKNVNDGEIVAGNPAKPLANKNA